MSASTDEAQTQPLSELEIDRLTELDSGGYLEALAFLVVPIVTVIVSDRYSAGMVWPVVVTSCVVFGLMLLGHFGVRAAIRADIDAGIKRFATARVVKLIESDEYPFYRLEMLSEETPAQTFRFTARPSLNLKIVENERVRIAYAPASKTIMNIVAASCEYAFAAEKQI
ncbi:hypothetical protein [Lysobacter sp. CA199]|uniref:hypothetical protein n=1 Tax=Lysobacter sp. CA199 TaxID=3455608 RepID=UPI003F8D6993